MYKLITWRGLIITTLLSAMMWCQYTAAQVQVNVSWCTNIPDTDGDSYVATSDIDKDGDGLIEICDLEGLDAIRYQLNGSGYKATADADVITAGCPTSGCRGYELMKDLDFSNDADYRSISNKAIWTVDDYENAEDTGWLPIGMNASFNTMFEGNEYTISNLRINRSADDSIGLFGEIGGNSSIAGLGLLNVVVRGNTRVGGLVGLVGLNNSNDNIMNSYVMGDVAGNSAVGGLVGLNSQQGSVTNSYATGVVMGEGIHIGGLIGLNIGNITNSYTTNDVEGMSRIGGLVGSMNGRIINSYATGDVAGNENVGGLVGYNSSDRIINSYATGDVTGNENVGSLVGFHFVGSIMNSYAAGAVTGSDDTNLAGSTEHGRITNSTHQTMQELQSPTAPGMTSADVYYGWSNDNWDFGSSSQYPILKYVVGPDQSNPACGIPEYPICGALLSDQFPSFLDHLIVSNGTLSPEFDPRVLAYDVMVALDVERLKLQTTATGGFIRIRSDASDTEVTDENTASAEIPLRPTSSTVITIDVIKSSQRTTSSYVLTVSYALPPPTEDDQLTGLQNLEVLPVDTTLLEPAFTTTGTTHYTVSFADDVEELQLQLTVADEQTTTTIRVGDEGTEDSEEGSREFTVSLSNVETSTITIDVKKSGQETIFYSISLQRVNISRCIDIVADTDGDQYPAAFDLDKDGNGLIEICDLEALNAIRYQPDGTAYRTSDDETVAAITVGCPIAEGCRGYELMKDLDFSDNASYSSPETNRMLWTVDNDTDREDTGWPPIKILDTILRGNGHTISNLEINHDETFRDSVGLFSFISANARIENLGLLNVDISGDMRVGGFTAENCGVIVNSYVKGGTLKGNFYYGGLVGQNEVVGEITNSYASTLEIELIEHPDRPQYAGGLVGGNYGTIANSYANTTISARLTSEIGGLVGGLLQYRSKSARDCGVQDDIASRIVSNVSNSYAAGSILGNNNAGGLIGAMEDGEVKNSYAVASVFGGFPGKLIGKYMTGVIEHSYSNGTPLIGSIVNDFNGIVYAFSDELLGLSTAQSISDTQPYYQWNDKGAGNDIVWYFGSDRQYPTLGYGIGPNVNDPACNDGNHPNAQHLLPCYADSVGTTNTSALLGGPQQNEIPLSLIPGGDVGLSDLKIFKEEMQLVLQPAFGTTTYHYTVIIDDSVKELSFVAEITDEEAAVDIAGNRYDGSTSTVALMNVDKIEIVVSKQGSVPTLYTVDIARMSCGDGQEPMDIDRDGDGLIEICDVEGLDAIRHQLAGSGYKANADAVEISVGCPDSGCRGYELSRDLDFEDSGSYADSSNMNQWTDVDIADSRGNVGWTPISYIDEINSFETGFTGVFDGNGYTISNLYIVKGTQKGGLNGRGVGLFAVLGSNVPNEEVIIRNIGLSSMDIQAEAGIGVHGVGGMVGFALQGTVATVANTYTTGRITAKRGNVGGLAGSLLVGSKITNSFSNVEITISDINLANNIGGLVGSMNGSIEDTYAYGTITIDEMITNTYSIGGLIGNIDGAVINSYAYVEGRRISGGLVGSGGSNVVNSYWDKTSGIESSSGGASKTTVALQSPTYATGIYAEWDVDHWNFGTSSHYPILGYGKGPDVNNPACNDGSDIDNPKVKYLPLCYVDNVGNINSEALLEGQLRAYVLPPVGLSDLSLSTGDVQLTLMPTFAPTTYSYNALIDDSVKNLDFTVSTIRRGATIMIGDELSTGTKTVELIDESEIKIVVTELEGTPTTYTISIARVSCGDEQPIDIDRDGDGLIELCDLEGLDAIRYQPAGSGYKTNADIAEITVGCPESGCRGYELTRDLDFNDDSSYADTNNKNGWTSGVGWLPIVSLATTATIFGGNSYTISNLRINRGETDDIGLFGNASENVTIENLGLLNVDIVGHERVGGLAGRNEGNIINSYVIGRVSGSSDVGGLIGRVAGNGSVANSYAAGNMLSMSSNIGGLIGVATGNADVANSYASGIVSGASNVGGLIGLSGGGTIKNSYTVADVFGDNAVGGFIGTYEGGILTSNYASGASLIGSGTSDGLLGFSNSVLAALSSQSSDDTQPYYQWNDKEAGNEIVWNFGTDMQYPALGYGIGPDMDNPACNDGGNSDNPKVRDLPLCYADNEDTIHTEAVLGNQQTDEIVGLNDLKVYAGDIELILEPAFAITTYSYAVTIDDGIKNLDFVVRAMNEDAMIAVEDNRYAGTTLTVALMNANEISIVVTEQDSGYTTYTMSIARVSCGDEQPVDIDRDGDGLIEICDLEGLNAIRHQPDGAGYRASDDETMNAITAGCPESGCRGYELTRDLDFNEDNSYADTDNKNGWTSDSGWIPIGSLATTFGGNGHTVSNVRINRGGTDDIGLFGDASENAIVENLGLLNVNITGHERVGGLIGINRGSVINSYVTGIVSGSQQTGGLVGIVTGKGSVANSYVNGRVSGPSVVGGLIGFVAGNGSVANSYALGNVSSSRFTTGGLIGTINSVGTVAYSYTIANVSGRDAVGKFIGNNIAGTFTNSYANGTTLAGRGSSDGILSFSDMELVASSSQSTTDTRPYYQWNDSDAGNEIVWDFGTDMQYPALGYGIGPDANNPACNDGSNSNHPKVEDLPLCYVDSTGNINADGLLGNQQLDYVPPPVGLNDLDIYAGSIELVLEPAFGSMTYSYAVIIDDGVQALGFIAEAANAEATITVAGKQYAGTTLTVVLMEASEIKVVVTEQDSVSTTYTVSIARVSCGDEQPVDIDRDGDGLIEICDLEGLDAIRYQLAGTGYKTNADAMEITAGCPESGCRGYELTRDLDFNEDDSYADTSNRSEWTSGFGWAPIGTSLSESFNATFRGNNFVISHLMIDRGASDIGLFGVIRNARIENLGLSNIHVIGYDKVGGLVATNQGVIVNSYIEGGTLTGNSFYGGLVGRSGPGGKIINSYVNSVEIRLVNDPTIQKYAGGLVGQNQGIIANSYANITILGNTTERVGGLIGILESGSSVVNSYAVGTVEGSEDVGGLIGELHGTVENSYTLVSVSGSDPSTVGTFAGEVAGQLVTISNSYANSTPLVGSGTSGGILAFSDAVLAEASAQSSDDTQPYYQWNDKDAGNEIVWDFGTATQYPALGYGIGSDVSDPACDDSNTVQHLPPCYADSMGTTNTAALLGNQPLDYVPPPSVGLNDLAIYAANIQIALEPAFESTTYSYAMFIDNGVEELDFIAEAENEEATITIAANLYARTPLTFALMDVSEIKVVVTEQDGESTTYTMSIARVSCGDEQPVDIDRDGDGLIEICDLDGLDAIRNQLTGSSYKANDEVAEITVGCPDSGCRGYELMRDLDFTNNDSYANTSNRSEWTSGFGWAPIGTSLSESFNATFSGNNFVISNLMIDRGAPDIGLFGVIRNARIENLGLSNMSVIGSDRVGGLVGTNHGVIVNSYIEGGTLTAKSSYGGLVGLNGSTGKIINSYVNSVKISLVNNLTNQQAAGGLSGTNAGSINNSYANITISGDADWVGGLVGNNVLGGSIANSYTIGSVSGRSQVGGLIGLMSLGTVKNSYTVASVSASSGAVGAFIGQANAGTFTSNYANSTPLVGSGSDTGILSFSDEKLKSSQSQSSDATQPYYQWNDSDASNEMVWDFGTDTQYPALGYGRGPDASPACDRIAGDGSNDDLPLCFSAAIASDDPEVIRNALFRGSQREASPPAGPFTIDLNLKVFLEGLLIDDK